MESLLDRLADPSELTVLDGWGVDMRMPSICWAPETASTRQRDMKAQKKSTRMAEQHLNRTTDQTGSHRVRTNGEYTGKYCRNMYTRESMTTLGMRRKRGNESSQLADALVMSCATWIAFQVVGQQATPLESVQACSYS